MNSRDVLMGITTFGSAPYVDLGLSFLKQYDCHLVVLDDGSKSDKLAEMCKKHEVIMWHEKHEPVDYYNKAKEIGLNYTLEDFKKVNG